MAAQRVLTDEFLTAFPIGDRKRYLAWKDEKKTKRTSKRFFGKDTYAAVVSGKPVSSKNILVFLEYLCDTKFRQNTEAVQFARYLQDIGVPQSSAYPSALLEFISEESCTPLETGMPALRDYFEICKTPIHGVSHASGSNLPESIKWIFLEGGRKLLGKNVSEGNAIKASEEFVGMKFDPYVDRLLQWSKASPWSVARGGASPDTQCVVTVTLPLSKSQYAKVRRGEVNAFHMLPEENEPESLHLFTEAIGRSRLTVGSSIIQMQMINVFRTFVIQQAALSDAAGLARREPLRILAPCCFQQFAR